MAKRESHEHETRDSSPIQGSTLPDVLLKGGVLGKVSHVLSTPIGGQPAAEAPASGAPAAGAGAGAGGASGGAGGAGSA